MPVNALKSRPNIEPETSYLLKVHGEVEVFGNLRDYCDYFGINDLEERDYLFRMMHFLKKHRQEK